MLLFSFFLIFNMNFKISIVVFLLLVALSLIGYAFSFIGIAGSLVDSIWKLVALSIGVGLVAGFVYPVIRGVRKGDLLSTTTTVFSQTAVGQVASFFTGPSAVALQGGRVGGRIMVQLQGRQAEGIIVAYASTFSPALIKLVEVEQVPSNVYRY